VKICKKSLFFSAKILENSGEDDGRWFYSKCSKVHFFDAKAVTFSTVDENPDHILAMFRIPFLTHAQNIDHPKWYHSTLAGSIPQLIPADINYQYQLIHPS
jgi:hypothetical protein